MAKHTESELNLSEIKRASDTALADIAFFRLAIENLETEAEAAMQAVRDTFASRLAPLRAKLKLNEEWLTYTMRSNKRFLFSGTDVVDLVHGSLVRTEADKVIIPRDALKKCKSLGLEDAIKIVESIDREAVEKWPDARLTLIGAVRKPKEEFKYSLKEAPCKG